MGQTTYQLGQDFLHQQYHFNIFQYHLYYLVFILPLKQQSQQYHLLSLVFRPLLIRSATL